MFATFKPFLIIEFGTNHQELTIPLSILFSNHSRFVKLDLLDLCIILFASLSASDRKTVNLDVQDKCIINKTA